MCLKKKLDANVSECLILISVIQIILVTWQISVCRHDQGNLLKIKLSIGMRKKVDISDFERCTDVGARINVDQNLRNFPSTLLNSRHEELRQS